MEEKTGHNKHALLYVQREMEVCMTHRAKCWLISGSLILTILTAASIYLIYSSINKAESTQTAFNEQLRTETEFIIREYNGTVCVFHEEYSNIPAIVTDIAIESLSDSDKALLLSGIRLSTREEVLMYLEDFGS